MGGGRLMEAIAAMLDRAEALVAEARYGEAYDLITTMTKLMLHRNVRISEAIILQQDITSLGEAARKHKGLNAAAKKYRTSLVAVRKTIDERK